MNLLHISDMHFGPRHWNGNTNLLLDKLNSYSTDIIINTGDSTTDSLEDEFETAGNFLKSIQCHHVISIVGNHDKRNMRSQDFFRQYIDKVDVIRPLTPENCLKKNIFHDEYTTGIKESFTDLNFIKKVLIDDKILLVVGLDTSEMYQDLGFIDKEMLATVSHKIRELEYDQIILLNHHSIVDTDSDPLFNSGRIIEFVREHKIEHVFCGHTHRLALTRSTDLYHNHTFTQYKNGSLSAGYTPKDSNMFLYYEDFGSEEMKILLVRIFMEKDTLTFTEETIGTC